jgi:tricorn protease
MTNHLKTAALFLLIALLAGPTLAAAEKPLLAQHPSLSRTQIVFAFAGDLWLTGRDGGPAARLTTGVGAESDPAFSPDGSLVAFSGQYDGNTDIYVVAAAGGIPRRLTHHPQPDTVVGWTPDGQRILFTSARMNANGIPMLFTVGLEGGMPEELPLPTGVSGSFSADGSRLAYVPTMLWQRAWKRYQGGQTTPIWIVSLADLKVEKIPRGNSNDSNPLWIGDKIYFLSDRNGAISLFVYDLAKGASQTPATA